MARNPLHAYVNWTYNISLYALSINDYNNNVCNSPKTDVGGSLLIASGGKQAGRNAHFKEDFYFDKLDMHCIAAPMVKSRNTNVLKITFTLIEPMGVTLFNRLIKVAESLGVKQLMAMPFVIKVDWKGYTPDGTPTAIPISKSFPVQFAKVTMKISTRGAQYDIEAQAYNHQAFNEMVAGSPVRIEASAPTIGEAFLSNSESTPPKSDLITVVPPSDTHVRSYTGALNKWFKNQANEKHATNTDSVVFEIDPEIAKAKLVDDKMVTVQGMYYPKPGTPEAKQDCVTTNSRPKACLNANMSFAQGTQIAEILGMMIRESTYISDQAKDEQKGEGDPGKGRMKWFKIITRVEVGPWEPAFNRYVNKYIYRVVPYMLDNTQNRSFPMANMATIPGPVKDYNYIFTGKNDDVIDLDLTFDALWVTTTTTNQENAPAISGGQVTTPTLDPKAHPGALAQLAAWTADYSNPGLHFAPPVFPVATTVTSLKLLDGSKNEKSRELQEQLLQKDSNLMSIKLKIIGDPDFITQNDFLFWNAKGPTTPNGSITTDNGPVYIRVTAKTAVDYNDQGLAIPGTGAYTIGSFSGIYQVLTIDNEFAQGKFTQVLTCTRFTPQPPEK